MSTKYPSQNAKQQSLNSKQFWESQSWTDEQLFSSTPDFYDSMIEAIDKAEKNIILTTYTFSWDEVGKRFSEHLGKAKQRGVDVSVLIDGFGSFETCEEVVNALYEKNINIRIYHPLPWQTQKFHQTAHKHSWLEKIVSRFSNANRRHHAKIFIVDEKWLWSGSQNITNEHMPKDLGGDGWHDYGVKVCGPMVAEVASIVKDFLNYHKPRFGKGLFRHNWNNLTAHNRRKKNKLLVKKIDSAQDFIWIINPYFSPTTKIVRALRRAGERGVDVRIIVPALSDIPFFPLLTAIHYKKLIQSSVRMFKYKPSILHAKLLLIDDFRLIGSSNFNHRSLLHDLEFDLVLKDENILQQTKDCFLKDQEDCDEIEKGEVELRGWRYFAASLLWSLRYWL